MKLYTIKGKHKLEKGKKQCLASNALHEYHYDVGAKLSNLISHTLKTNRAVNKVIPVSSKDVTDNKKFSTVLGIHMMLPTGRN